MGARAHFPPGRQRPGRRQGGRAGLGAGLGAREEGPEAASGGLGSGHHVDSVCPGQEGGTGLGNEGHTFPLGCLGFQVLPGQAEPSGRRLDTGVWARENSAVTGTQVAEGPWDGVRSPGWGDAREAGNAGSAVGEAKGGSQRAGVKGGATPGCALSLENLSRAGGAEGGRRKRDPARSLGGGKMGAEGFCFST